MGVLDRFEKGIERAVNGAFAKAFRSEVQPVEIASALRNECDDNASIVGRDRTIVPNTFVVELSHADHERLGEWTEALGEELTAAVHEHARQQRYAFVGPVTVGLEEGDDLDTGVFRVRSTTTRPAGQPGAGQPSAAEPGPAEANAPAAAAAPAGIFPVAPGPVAPPAWATAAPSATSDAPDVPAWVAPARGGVPTLELDGRLYRLEKAVTVIGRAADADVVVDDPGVSRRHAEVHILDGRARVIDLGSTNGTFVDGERVHAGTLTDGSTITVGRSRLAYRFGQW